MVSRLTETSAEAKAGLGEEGEGARPRSTRSGERLRGERARRGVGVEER